MKGNRKTAINTSPRIWPTYQRTDIIVPYIPFLIFNIINAFHISRSISIIYPLQNKVKKCLCCVKCISVKNSFPLWIHHCFIAATVRGLGLSEYVGTSVWMSGCSDSELENFTLLTVHTPETVTSLTPWGTLTKIHLLCSTRWGKSFFCRCCWWWRQNTAFYPRQCLQMRRIRHDRA